LNGMPIVSRVASVLLAALVASCATDPASPAPAKTLTIDALTASPGRWDGTRVRVEAYISLRKGAATRSSTYFVIHGAERTVTPAGEVHLRCLSPGELNLYLGPAGKVAEARAGLDGHRVIVSGIFRHKATWVPHGGITFEYPGSIEQAHVEESFSDSCSGVPSATVAVVNPRGHGPGSPPPRH